VLRLLAGGALSVALARRLYGAAVDGSLTLDTGVGRRLRPLGPQSWEFDAPRELVFDLIAVPYGERPPRALREKVEVWERGGDMVLAAHRTRVGGRTVTTVETVRWERPGRFEFRLVRGPVPHVSESFVLEEQDGRTRLTWSGELGTDFGPLGAWWGDRVAAAWQRAVEHSLAAVTAEIERQSHE
jgi:Polyketide cyclase / dehydrase and lipid transport